MKIDPIYESLQEESRFKAVHHRRVWNRNDIESIAICIQLQSTLTVDSQPISSSAAIHLAVTIDRQCPTRAVT